MHKIFALALFLSCFSQAPLRAQTTPSPAATPSFDTRDVAFDSDGIRLAGRLFAPRSLARFPIVVYIEGSDPDDAIAAPYVRAVANGFAKKGIGLFAYDKRGIAQSAGISSDDFAILGKDAAAAYQTAERLPEAKPAATGFYAIGQGGWVLPYALAYGQNPAFVILVSPAAVAPSEQIDYYLANQYKAQHLSDADVAAAVRLHDVVAHYLASGKGYETAQHAVNVAMKSGWFAAIRKVDFRQDIPGSGRLPTPAKLAEIDRRDPQANAFYRSAQTWRYDESLYARITAPVLVLYGAADQVVPVAKSRSILNRVFVNTGNYSAFHVFDNADHAIQVPGKGVLLPGYREFMADWVLALETKTPSQTAAVPSARGRN